MDAAFERYRSAFQPSFLLAEPHVMVAVSVLCAPETEEAQWLAGPSALAILQLRSGRLAPLPSPEEAAAYDFSPAEAALVAETTATHLVGDPALVAHGLVELQARTGADEIMLSTRAHSLEARARSLALIAENMPAEPESVPIA
jgi:alkanesulfonate monooxygenase SsuD/methylene tetrahydromethanopterin reductase-like flavin-dependent oxidoreductase (luciferase family)